MVADMRINCISSLYHKFVQYQSGKLLHLSLYNEFLQYQSGKLLQGKRLNSNIWQHTHTSWQQQTSRSMSMKCNSKGISKHSSDLMDTNVHQRWPLPRHQFVACVLHISSNIYTTKNQQRINNNPLKA
jgi:hypothetical protein